MSEKNDEKGRARLSFGSTFKEKSVRAETKARAPSSDELKKHVESCSQAEPPGRLSSSQAAYFMEQLAIGLLVTLIGVVCFFVFGPQYAKSNTVVPGATVVFFLGGLAGMIGGVVYMFYSLWDFLRGAKQRSPQEVVGSFVTCIDKGNYGRAWNCLAPEAREEFKTEKGFKQYVEELKRQLPDKVDSLLGTRVTLDPQVEKEFNVGISQSFEAENVEVAAEQEEATVVHFDLVVKQNRSISRKSNNKHQGFITDGHVAFPQANGAVRWGEYWYLTSGRLHLA